MQELRYYPWLDVLKYFMATLIIMGHTDIFEEWPVIFEGLTHVTEIAVPVFFSASAFLFFRKLETSPETEHRSIVFHSIKRLCIFFAVWYVLMLPLSIPDFFMKANWKELLFVIPFRCAFWGYWFIKALIINTVILFICRKKRALIICAVLSSLIYLFFGYDYVYGEIGQTLHPYYTFFYHLYAFVFGALVARYLNRIPSWMQNPGILLATTLALMAMGFFPWFRVISKLLYPVVLLLFAMNINKPIKGEVCKVLRAMSILYYVIQFAVIAGYKALFPESSSIIRFLIVFGICTLISMLIVTLEQKRSFSFLKYTH